MYTHIIIVTFSEHCRNFVHNVHAMFSIVNETFFSERL